MKKKKISVTVVLSVLTWLLELTLLGLLQGLGHLNLMSKFRQGKIRHSSFAVFEKPKSE